MVAFLKLGIFVSHVICFGVLIYGEGMAVASDENKRNGTIVITEEEIGAMNAHKMADVLNHVPGVTAGDSSVGIHGSYKVKVFVDGRPINDPTSSHGGVNWELVNPSDVARIEILRGKGGLQYGQDASGGVILITTKETDDVSGSVKAYGGSHDTYYGHATLQQVKGPWTFSMNGGYEETGGYKINNDKQRSQGGVKWGYAWNDRYRLRFTADYLEDERGASGQPDYPTPFSRKKSQNTNISLGGDLGPVKSNGFFNQGENHNTDPSLDLDRTFKVSKWGEDLNTSLTTGEWGTLNLGGAYHSSHASGNNFKNQDEETWSLFAAQALSRKGSPFSLGLGLRANINTAFDDVVNPEIKLSYSKKNFRFTASYNRSNNTPSFRQRYNETSSTLPNPDLEMETSDNYSLAWFLNPGDNLSLSLSLFHNRLNDRITYVSLGNGMSQYQNVGLVTYTGGDVAGSVALNKIITVKGGYTYLDAIDEETGLRLTAKAEHTATLDLYVKPLPSLSLVMTNKYVSKVYRNKANTKHVPEYTLTDVRVEFTWKRCSLFGEIENICDKTYYYSDGLLAPPRVFKAGMTVNL